MFLQMYQTGLLAVAPVELDYVRAMTRLKATYSVSPSVEHRADVVIVLESRGGSKSGGMARNPDYAKQLSRILRVLQKSECTITRIEVLSKNALRTRAERKLNLKFPIQMSQVASIERLRQEIQAAQRTVSQRPGASGGNSTKRIGIWVRSGSVVPALGLDFLLRRE
jgi:hypothetical protein